MTMSVTSVVLPDHKDLYFGGSWHPPVNGTYDGTRSLDLRYAGLRWLAGCCPPRMSAHSKKIAVIIRRHGDELALLDSANCGNPYAEMKGDAQVAATQMEFFAGLVTEMKGHTIPMGSERVNMTVLEPLGVVARILAFNHPLMFCGSKIGAPLAAGNAVIVKPPAQAPLSALRLAELIDGLLPDGVFNVLPGGTEAGASLASHPGVDKVTLIGSVAAGKAVMKSASDALKPVLLELGGKNALIVYPDSDPAKVADAIVAGMNFSWCGQSCGSTSRAFVHEDLHDDVVDRLAASVQRFKPGLPQDPSTTMGAFVGRQHFDRVMDYITSGKAAGARVVTGGSAVTEGALSKGCFVVPTIFADVTPDMRIASE